MKLPEMRYADGIRKSKQVKFGGLDHSQGAGDGALWDMKNLCSDSYPLLASRKPRRLIRKLNNPGGIFAYDKLCWVDGSKFYYDGKVVGEVTIGQKMLASVGPYIVIFPDKCCYNTATGEFKSMEARAVFPTIKVSNGTLYGEPAEWNTIGIGEEFSKMFSVGDAVTIKGAEYESLNKTVIIREIDGDYLRFYDNTFYDATLDAQEGAGEKGVMVYCKEGVYEITIERTVPDLDWLCENENRLWGAKGGTVYCSKGLGDIFNWNVFDGLGTDAWTTESGSVGDFCGAVSYIGFPTFFKETGIYKAYGSLPSNFQLLGSASLGLEKESGRSLAVAGETLFYLNRTGIMAYTGGVPQPVNKAFGNLHFQSAVGGSDGLKYFVSMQDMDGRWRLYVYDTQCGQWHIEDDVHALGFALLEGCLYMLTATGEIWAVSGGSDGMLEEKVEWMAEFGDFTEEDPNKKGVSKLQIRMELEEDAKAQVWIQYDSDGQWLKVGPQLGQNVKRSYYLPVIPRRCDHYRIKIEGEGECRIHSIVREVYSGSEFRSTKGRN